jgi:polysaccharide export outer membrane protein
MSRVTKNILGVVLLGLLAGGAVTASAQSTPANLKNSASGVGGNSSAVASRDVVVAEDYMIGSDDVLAINVWKEPDLSRTVPVRPDGKITLPLIGDIIASGNTPKQLQASIEQDLAKYISKPAVTVIVQEPKSHKFNIVGEVQRPGSYLLTSPITVLDAIALAGGFREWAKVKSIYVLRVGANGTRTRVAFNYKKVIRGHDNEQNIPLRSGDTVVVP